jgi:hypothetical protein
MIFTEAQKSYHGTISNEEWNFVVVLSNVGMKSQYSPGLFLQRLCPGHHLCPFSLPTPPISSFVIRVDSAGGSSQGLGSSC